MACNLSDHVTSIGRHPDSTVVLDDASVSSHHAEIIVADGRHTLRDLRSTNGTKVNGKATSEITIVKGDIISFGAVECIFEDLITPNEPAQTDPATGAKIEALLQKCGPLSNPVILGRRFVEYILVLALGLFLAGVLVAGFTMFFRSPMAKSAPQWRAIATFVSLFLAAPLMALSQWLLFRLDRRGEQNLCLFLRVFRAEESHGNLPAWLKAALGHEFKLSGIRPPAARASWLSIIGSPALTGLCLLGSPLFELEASERNCTARLLATLSRTRLVFIDMRELDSHLREQIYLACVTLSPKRCVFIVDDSILLEDWRLRIIETLGYAGPSDELRMLVWPRDESPDERAFFTAMERLIVSIPNGPVKVPPVAVSHVCAKTSRLDWKTPWLERDSAIVVAYLIAQLIAIPLLLAFAGTILRFSGVALPVAQAAYIFVFLAVSEVIFWDAWLRLLGQENLAKRLNPFGLHAFGRLRAAAALKVAGVAVWVVGILLAVSAFREVREKSRRIVTEIYARQLESTIFVYQMDHEKRFPVERSDNKHTFVVMTPDSYILTALLNDRLFADGRQAMKFAADGWGTPFHIWMDVKKEGVIVIPGHPEDFKATMVIQSAGPDRIFGNQDDVFVTFSEPSIQRPKASPPPR